MSQRSAAELVNLVLDEGSFECWDSAHDLTGVEESYRQDLLDATERTGASESIITGRGTVRGRPVVLIVSEFRFLAGSIGVEAARRITAAVRRATAERLPVLAAPASGGTRMQEGTGAFIKMIEIAQSVQRHRAAGLPFLVYLRHPTTGGVYASWGSLGQVTAAEPHAMIGFLGPKVYEGIYREPFPEGVQRAEHLLTCGVIDAVVPHEDLRQFVDMTLGVLCDPASPRTIDEARQLIGRPGDAWASIAATRSVERAGVRDILRAAGESTVRLRGTCDGQRDDSVLVALTRLDGQPCVVVGQDRTRQDSNTQMGPGALRQAQRGMRLAGELGLPLVTFIDTPGAELSAQAEEHAVAGEIARCMAILSSLESPTVSVLLGQGCGGGAIALLSGRVVLATENSWLSPLPPEGASIIVHGTPDHAQELANRQGIRSSDLVNLGFVYEVIGEAGGPSPESLARSVAAVCAREIRRQVGISAVRDEVAVGL